MRALLWAWVVGTTALLLFMPPMLEKQRSRQGEPVRWENTGPFEQSVFGISIHETRVDIPRLIVAILAINFLPAVALGAMINCANGCGATRGKSVSGCGATRAKSACLRMSLRGSLAFSSYFGWRQWMIKSAVLTKHPPYQSVLSWLAHLPLLRTLLSHLPQDSSMPHPHRFAGQFRLLTNRLQAFFCGAPALLTRAFESCL
jgi:hypothetical protein